MTAEKFGELTADLWRARQRWEKAAKAVTSDKQASTAVGLLAIDQVNALADEVQRLAKRLADYDPA